MIATYWPPLPCGLDSMGRHFGSRFYVRGATIHGRKSEWDARDVDQPIFFWRLSSILHRLPFSLKKISLFFSCSITLFSPFSSSSLQCPMFLCIGFKKLLLAPQETRALLRETTLTKRLHRTASSTLLLPQARLSNSISASDRLLKIWASMPTVCRASCVSSSNPMRNSGSLARSALCSRSDYS